jgi:alpha-tubulin suppressor-like RCC1 family protein
LTPVAVGGGLRFVAVNAGTTSACGVTSSGAAYCWGDNGRGQLGAGPIGLFSATPVRVLGAP